jgi:phosphoenolpyruvate carboxykinase (ATP)
MYYFLSGYTAKVAGTERGVKEPQPTFSACFGAVFLPLHPNVYAEMLGKKLQEHQARGVAGEHRVDGRPLRRGERMKLPYTRAMVRAALAGELDGVETPRCRSSASRCPPAVPGVPRPRC